MAVSLNLSMPDSPDRRPLTERLAVAPGVFTTIDCAPADLPDVLAAPDSRVVFVTGPVDADTIRNLTSAGVVAGLDLAATDPEIADFLAVLAHSATGFLARAHGGEQAMRIVAATVAALRGDDIRSALAEPDVEALRTLSPAAASAVGEVLLGIEFED